MLGETVKYQLEKREKLLEAERLTAEAKKKEEKQSDEAKTPIGNVTTNFGPSSSAMLKVAPPKGNTTSHGKGCDHCDGAFWQYMATNK